MSDQYPNPVRDLPPEERKIVTVDLVAKDWLLLKGCDLTHGSLTATFNNLVTALANECRKRGIVDFSKTTEFRELVLSIGFVPRDSIIVTREELDTLREQSCEYQRILASGLRDSTASRSTRKTNGRTNTRRTSRTRDKNTPTQNTAGVQSGSGSGDEDVQGQTLSGETGEAS